MGMKAKLIVLFVLVFSQLSIGQDLNCVEKENQLNKFVADKEYKKANELWSEIKSSCAKYNESLYVLESKVLQYNIEVANPENTEKAVRELLQLFDLYDKNFPNNTNGNFEKRAMVLFDNKIDANEEIYANLDKAFNLQKNTFINPQALYTYFKLYFDKNNSDKTQVTIQKLISKYIDVSSLVNANIQKLSFKTDEYNRVKQGMNSLMNGLLTCDNLIPYIKFNFTSNNKDAEWLSFVGEILVNKCSNSPMLEAIASNLHQLNPSSRSAYFLATYYMNTGKIEKGTEFYIQSASLESNKIEKATTCYTIASILSTSDKAKSKEMVLTAIENNPSNGAYYIFLANLYANAVNECATIDIEKKAIYKLASNTVLKAVAIEPRFKVTAENMSKDYLKHVDFPPKTKIKPVKLGCWINQTVQF
jgi:tetratricopeptide (TPR) repeat protein